MHNFNSKHDLCSIAMISNCLNSAEKPAIQILDRNMHIQFIACLIYDYGISHKWTHGALIYVVLFILRNRGGYCKFSWKEVHLIEFD